MCNGNNHDPGCMCGFGGEGHLGGGHGNSSCTTSPGYIPGERVDFGESSFRMSRMAELAVELGYSVVFPVHCRYCGMPVYLFASPDGGFVVFDELGPPWPKHRCMGLS